MRARPTSRNSSPGSHPSLRIEVHYLARRRVDQLLRARQLLQALRAQQLGLFDLERAALVDKPLPLLLQRLQLIARNDSARPRAPTRRSSRTASTRDRADRGPAFPGRAGRLPDQDARVIDPLAEEKDVFVRQGRRR